MKEKILLIDDEPGIVETLGEILKTKGFDVSGAFSGKEAIDFLKNNFFDLIITDIRMPDTDGFEVMRYIREKDYESEIIVLTGYPSIEIAVDTLKTYRAYDFLVKPLLNTDQLVITVEQALEKRRLNREKNHLFNELAKANEFLRQEIEERVKIEDSLRKSEEELKIKTANLEEVNTALKVLLKKREEDKTDIEEKVLFNVKEFISPYLEKLKKSSPDEKQKTYIEIIESNLNDIVSPFIQELSPKYLQLTPSEIQIANLIKQGKTTKEIAEILNLSPRTIECHRDNIRKKIGLKDKKINLRTYLLSVTPVNETES